MPSPSSEVQVLGDAYGNVVHLFDRECSVQRRFQKIVEEAPSPTLGDAERRRICDIATGIARAAGYRNAGTIEFIYGDGEFFFLEMNTRLQVEHPVTELITGVIIGRSPVHLAVLDKVGRVAHTDATVLICGETGTGKELIARAIHSNSRRRDKPLIKLNCAALPAGLVESELFGHEKGAFTGAITRRIGRFELADGGTIFLDEIGELPADTQAKLLRVLQEHEFDRVGGTSPRRVDVRVIAATNRDLLKAVNEKAFREDLYYRLSVFPILLPPLRQRSEDVPLLVRFLLDRFATRIGKSVDCVSQETMQRLIAYSWPGNIRELENVLERAVILATGPTLEIGLDVLSEPVSATAAGPRLALEDVERDHILNVLGQTGWVIDGPKGAATVLGLHPNTLRSRLKKLGIERAPHDRS